MVIGTVRKCSAAVVGLVWCGVAAVVGPQLQRLHWIMYIRFLVSQVRLDLIGRVSQVEKKV